jgi:hypothetical protein
MQGRAEAAPQSQSGAGGKKTRDVQPVLECRAGQELDSSIMSGGKQRKRDAAGRDVFHGARPPEPGGPSPGPGILLSYL